MSRVLVTGMSGLIGGALRARLEPRAELRALNRSAVAGVDTVRADLADREAMRPAFEGVDAVVHLAAKAGERYGWEALHETNVVGTYNVFREAVDAGVPRVIFASSGATVAGWEREEPYRALVEGRYDELPASWPLVDHTLAPRPAGIYGSSKVWGEALARHFADATETAFLSVRIGYVNAEDRPSTPRHFAVWCSQRDIAAALAASVEVERVPRCETFFVTSANRYGYRDLSHAREVVGFEPMDEAEAHR